MDDMNLIPTVKPMAMSNVAYVVSTRTTMCDIMCTTNSAHSFKPPTILVENTGATSKAILPYEKRRVPLSGLRGTTKFSNMKFAETKQKRIDELKRDRELFLDKLFIEKYEKDHEKNLAATKIQASFRGHNARPKLSNTKKNEKNVPVLTQNEMQDELCRWAVLLNLKPIPGLSLEARSKASRRRNRIENAAAFRIQRFFSLIRAKNFASAVVMKRRKEKIDESARVVTRAVRFMKTKNFVGRCELIKANRMAVVLQCKVRAFQAINRVKRIRAKREDLSKETTAATILQRNFRKYYGVSPYTDPQKPATRLNKLRKRPKTLVAEVEARKDLEERMRIKAEKDRLERIERTRIEMEKKEREMKEQALEQAQKDRRERIRREKERLERERQEKERLEQERIEKEKLLLERMAAEEADMESQELQQLEREKEAARLRAEEKERAEKEKAEKNRIAREKAEMEKMEREKAEELKKQEAEKWRLQRLEQQIDDMGHKATLIVAAAMTEELLDLAVDIAGLEWFEAKLAEVAALNEQLKREREEAERQLEALNAATPRLVDSSPSKTEAERLPISSTVPEFIQRLAARMFQPPVDDTRMPGESDGVRPGGELDDDDMDEEERRTARTAAALSTARTEASQQLTPALVADIMEAAAKAAAVRAQREEEEKAEKMRDAKQEAEKDHAFVQEMANAAMDSGLAASVDLSALQLCEDDEAGILMDNAEEDEELPPFKYTRFLDPPTEEGDDSSSAQDQQSHSRQGGQSRPSAGDDESSAYTSQSSQTGTRQKSIPGFVLSAKDKVTVDLAIDRALAHAAAGRWTSSLEELLAASELLQRDSRGISPAETTDDVDLGDQELDRNFQLLHCFIDLHKGCACFALAIYPDAKVHFDAVSNERLRWLGPTHVLVAESIMWLAEWNRAQALYSDAERLILQASKVVLGSPNTSMISSVLDSQVIGPEHEVNDEFLLNLQLKVLICHAETMKNGGQYYKANDLLTRAQSLVNGTTPGGASYSGSSLKFSSGAPLSRPPSGSAAQQAAVKAPVVRFETQSDLVVAIASMYVIKGKYANAASLHEELLEKRMSHYDALAKAQTNHKKLKLAATVDTQGANSSNVSANQAADAEAEKARNESENDVVGFHPKIASSKCALGFLKLMGKGDHVSSLALIEESLNIRKSMYAEDHPAIAASLFHKAHVFLARGQYQEASALMSASLTMRLQKLGEQHPSVSQSLIGLASIQTATGYPFPAMENLRKAVKYLNAAYGTDAHRDVAEAMFRLGCNATARGSFLEAVSYFQDCLQLREALLPLIGLGARGGAASANAAIGSTDSTMANLPPQHAHIDVEITKMYLANLLTVVSRIDLSKEMLKNSIKSIRKIMGGGSASFATGMWYLGRLCKTRGNYADAKTLFNIHKNTLIQVYQDENHPEIGWALMDSAENFRILGYFQQAFEECQRSLEILTLWFSSDNVIIAQALLPKAHALRDLTRFEEAEEIYKHCLNVLVDNEGTNNAHYAAALAGLAECNRQQLKYSPASEGFLQAVEIQKLVYGENSLAVAETLCNYSVMLVDMKNYEEAFHLLNGTVIPVMEGIFGHPHQSMSTIETHKGESYLHVWPLYARANLGMCTTSQMNSVASGESSSVPASIYRKPEIFDFLDYCKDAGFAPDHPWIRRFTDGGMDLESSQGGDDSYFDDQSQRSGYTGPGNDSYLSQSQTDTNYQNDNDSYTSLRTGDEYTVQTNEDDVVSAALEHAARNRNKSKSSKHRRTYTPLDQIITDDAAEEHARSIAESSQGQYSEDYSHRHGDDNTSYRTGDNSSFIPYTDEGSSVGSGGSGSYSRSRTTDYRDDVSNSLAQSSYDRRNNDDIDNDSLSASIARGDAPPRDTMHSDSPLPSVQEQHRDSYISRDSTYSRGSRDTSVRDNDSYSGSSVYDANAPNSGASTATNSHDGHENRSGSNGTESRSGTESHSGSGSASGGGSHSGSGSGSYSTSQNSGDRGKQVRGDDTTSYSVQPSSSGVAQRLSDYPPSSTTDSTPQRPRQYSTSSQSANQSSLEDKGYDGGDSVSIEVDSII